MPGGVVDTSLGGVRVVRELERLTIERATPETVVSDNGTELTSARCCAGQPEGWRGTTSSQASRCRTHYECEVPLASATSLLPRCAHILWNARIVLSLPRTIRIDVLQTARSRTK